MRIMDRPARHSLRIPTHGFTACVIALLAVLTTWSTPGALAAQSTEPFPYRVYLVTLVYGLLLRQGRGASRQGAIAQVVGDVILASSLVYLTGAADSPFVFTYSLAVVAAAILLFRWGAMLTATATA